MTVEQAIADTPADELRADPWVYISGQYVRVCYACYQAAGWEDGLCSTCDDRRRWHEFCPPAYRKYPRVDQLAEGHNPWPAEQVDQLRDFLAESDTVRVLGLISRPGRRKTTAAFAAVRAMWDSDLHEDPESVYVMASEMIDDLKARQFESDAYDRYTGADVLLLDELGDRDDGLTGFERKVLHRVIETRLREEKWLIWTSNLTLRQLKDWCHERTWERLWSDAVILQVGGASTRRLAS